jgi:Holliday junction resolvase RusA-like endonuclease
MNAMVKGHHEQVSEIARHYTQAGSVDFTKLLSISLHGRIPNLTHVYGYEAIHKLIAALLKAFNDAMNLIRPMTDEQIFDCSEALVMTTEEDQLSIEDYVLFFKGAKEGKYGKILDRMDQQTVFMMLEEYRDQRHKQFIKIKEEKQIAHKTTGITERTNQPNPIAESMVQLGGRLNQMKEQLREQREINRMKHFNP